MSPGRPANLTHSTAYLTDKPYDVQLGVLRWIRELLSEVVDDAASQLSTTTAAAPIEPDQGTCGVNSPSVQGQDLALPDAEERQENGRVREQQDAGISHRDSGAGGESTLEVSKAEPSSTEEESRAGMRTTEGAGVATTAAAVDGAGGVGSASVGRKRPRAQTQQRRDCFGLGDVVECFHADDGLWYPATITAIIVPPREAPPLERAESSEEKAAPNTETTSEGLIVGAPQTEIEVASAPLLVEKQPSDSTLQGSPQIPASDETSVSAVGAVGVEGEDLVSSTPAVVAPAGGEEGGVRSSVTVSGSELEAVAGGEGGGEARQKEQEQQHQELLEVTFLGYGNQARVPHDWVREIVTPEVLEWCRENGITAATAGAVEEACPPSAGDAAAAAAATAVTVHADDDGVFDATAPATTVMTRAEAIDGTKATATSAQADGSEGEHRVAEKDGAPSAAGTAVDGPGEAGGKQRKQQPRKRKKNSNKKNNGKNTSNQRNNNNSNNKYNRRRAAGSRQTGTPEEEEERFLMRCASRSRSPYPHVPNKYWGQRYRYFSRFDEGVTMDEEGWYSVTPEAIARHIAERVCCDVVVDPFVGCGGNAVQFALVAHVVFAIDVDPVKLEHARRNAAIYGVENRIEFILGDAMKVLPTLKADAVFLSPPWGGPAYQDSKTFDLNTMIPPPLSALEMFRAAREVTPNVIFFLPRNVDVNQVAGLPAAAAAATAAAAVPESENAGEGGDGGVPGVDIAELGFDDTCELEKHFLNGKLKTTTAYFGEDIAITAAAKKDAEGGTADGSGKGVAGVVVPALDDAASPDAGWYGGEDKGKVAAWTGRHVRFSDDGEGDETNVGANGCGVGGGVEGSSSGDGGGGQDKPVTISRKRENDLYEAWLAT